MPATPLDDAITTIGLGGPGISWGEVDDKVAAEEPVALIPPQQGFTRNVGKVGIG